MKSLLSFLAVALLATVAYAQVEQEPEVQVAEAMRRGDMVVIMGEGPRAAEDEAYAAAMAPPADDSHLWYVTVWTTPGCAACEHLKSDFRKAPELTCFVAAPQSGALPWAHYTEYSGADETQKDRRTKYKVTSYPTIVVQPPRNQMWGDPALVVFYQAGYDGNAKALASKIQKAVRRFADVQSKKGFPKQASLLRPQKALVQDAVQDGLPSADIVLAATPITEGASQIGADPPFPSPPKPDPFNPSPSPQTPQTQPGPSTWPPSDPPSQNNLAVLVYQVLSQVLSLFGMVMPSAQTMAAILLAIQTGLWLWEFQAKKTPSKWDDNTIAALRRALGLPDPNPTQTPPALPPAGPSSTA